MFFLSILAGLIKGVISAYKAQPLLGRVRCLHPAEHVFHTAGWLGKARLCRSIFCSRFLQGGFVAGEAEGF